MKITKVQKGITLIAVIITIIILLILAVVTIEGIRSRNIILYAHNASYSYEKGKEEEKKLLSQYETQLQGQDKIGQWELQEDGKIKNTKTGNETEIGKKVPNEDVLKAKKVTSSNYTGDWIVLGVEHGKLKLVSAANVVNNVILGKTDPNAIVDETLKDNNILDNTAKAIYSYQHAIETLDGQAKAGTGIQSARSITAEDLETKEVLDITETVKKQIAESDTNKVYNYGKTYNYFWNQGKVSSRNRKLESDDWSEEIVSKFAKEIFVDSEGKTVLIDSKNDEITLKSTYWGQQYIFSLEQKNKFPDLLTTNNTTSYWLASLIILAEDDAARFSIQCIMNGYMGISEMFTSTTASYTNSYGVRAVVYI